MNIDRLTERIFVALDFPTFDEACKIMDSLDNITGAYKVGSQLFTSVGPKIIKEIKSRNKKIFLDLKFHDIPNTVAGASESATELGVDIFNMHISGGLEMIKTSVNAVKSKASQLGINKPIILGITILTSIDESMFRHDFDSNRDLESQILFMAKSSQNVGIDGVVASPKEIELLRSNCGENFIILTPGIRPNWSSKGDQKRTMTPAEAFKAGADYIVIGRPIYHSANPTEAFKQIIDEIENS